MPPNTHIHVERDRHQAKFWLGPVRLQSSDGFRGPELRTIERLVTDNAQALLRGWYEFFGDQDD